MRATGTALGWRMGAKGLREAAFDERAGQCAGFGAPSPDGAAYLEGRKVALFRLCTDAGGYDYGRAGRVYEGVCRPEQEADFLGGYISGRRIYGFAARRNAAQSSYDNAVSSLESARYTIRSSRRTLRDEEASEKKKQKARKRLKDARESIPDLERRIDDALYTLGRADEAFDRALAYAPEWRRGREYENVLSTLQETQIAARAIDAIDYCTDELPRFSPTCRVRSEMSVKDSLTDQICAVGPGNAELVARGLMGDSGVMLSFEYYPDILNSGLRSLLGKRSGGEFDVMLGASRELQGIGCPAGVFPEPDEAARE